MSMLIKELSAKDKSLLCYFNASHCQGFPELPPTSQVLKFASQLFILRHFSVFNSNERIWLFSPLQKLTSPKKIYPSTTGDKSDHCGAASRHVSAEIQLVFTNGCIRKVVDSEIQLKICMMCAQTHCFHPCLLLSFLPSFFLPSPLSYPLFSLSLGPRADSTQTQIPCLGLGEFCIWPLLGFIMVVEVFFPSYNGW